MNPWFKRGAREYYGVGAGVFVFDQTNGNAWSDVSFRVVLLFTMIYVLYKMDLRIYCIVLS